MQSNQRWDKENGGVIGEDDELISFTSAEDSWWDEDVEITGVHKVTKRVTINTRSVVSRDAPDNCDNNTLPSLNTKADDVEENDAIVMKVY